MGRNNRMLERNVAVFNSWASCYDFPCFRYWMKKFQTPVLKEINYASRPHVLDISCGTGELLASLHRKSSGKATLAGVDVAEKMLANARKKLPSRVRLQKADAHQLPFRNNTFDYVITTEAFHHYYDQQRAIREMGRVAKKGGKVIIVDVNFFIRPIHFLFQRLEPGCVRINSKKEMKALFAKAGLTVEKQQRSFGFAVMTAGVKK